jgi:malonate transporter and related proteins
MACIVPRVGSRLEWRGFTHSLASAGRPCAALAHSLPMIDALVLLPDFSLIAIGWLLCRHTPLNRPLWDGVERLVYFVLFPVLLFGSIVRFPISLDALLSLGGVGLTIVGTGVALAAVLRVWPQRDARLHASGQQVAFRFNSYIALALSERLAGAQGLAWMAVLISACVPLCNVAAVWPLARHGGHGYWRELARNPLILATAAGLLANAVSLQLPEFVTTTMQRIGNAALPLGLMAVGAGLRFGALREGPGLAAALLAIRHLVLPALAIALVLWQRLPPAQQAAIVAFAALPTAPTSYVLAVRMGGHGAYVAGLVTVSTLLAMPGLPLALAALSALR